MLRLHVHASLKLGLVIKLAGWLIAGELNKKKISVLAASFTVILFIIIPTVGVGSFLLLLLHRYDYRFY